MSVLLSNIQRFSLHDGPGIRTTVFLKGCSLHCPWCANPENISNNIQYYYDERKCQKKEGTCLFNKNCTVLKGNQLFDSTDETECSVNAINHFGRKISNKELLAKILTDSAFYGQGGGVTFSGGEPLLQFACMEELLHELKYKGINICVETALFVPAEYVQLATKYVNLFFIDIKILNPSMCKTILGGDIEKYKQNIIHIHNSGIPYIFRIPLVKGYTYTKENLIEIKEFLKLFNPLRIEIFSVHNLAETKYKLLNHKYHKFEIINSKELDEIKHMLDNEKVEIIKI